MDGLRPPLRFFYFGPVDGRRNMQGGGSTADLIREARRVGHLEGRAEAAEEIANLQEKISELYQMIETQSTVELKRIMSTVYGTLKHESWITDTNQLKQTIRRITMDLMNPNTTTPKPLSTLPIQCTTIPIAHHEDGSYRLASDHCRAIGPRTVSDFQWLAQSLSCRFPYACVPLLPIMLKKKKVSI